MAVLCTVLLNASQKYPLSCLFKVAMHFSFYVSARHIAHLYLFEIDIALAALLHIILFIHTSKHFINVINALNCDESGILIIIQCCISLVIEPLQFPMKSDICKARRIRHVQVAVSTIFLRSFKYHWHAYSSSHCIVRSTVAGAVKRLLFHKKSKSVIRPV